MTGVLALLVLLVAVFWYGTTLNEKKLPEPECKASCVKPCKNVHQRHSASKFREIKKK